MAAGAKGQFNFNNLASGDKLQVLGQALYGYGYSTPWSGMYENPVVGCGRPDFEQALQEFLFLFYPDPSVDASILVYYVSEFTRTVKLKLYCLVNSISIIDSKTGQIWT